MKNILIYTEKWASGGIESILSELIRNIDKSNLNINILVAKKESDFFCDELDKSNVNIYEVLKNRINNPILRTLKTILSIRSEIKKRKPDVMHINIYNSVGLIYALIARTCGIKRIIIHAHNSGIDNDKFKIKIFANIVSKKILTRKDYSYIACSKEAADFCFDTKRIKNYEILKNGIHTERFIFNKKIRLEYRKKYNIEKNCIVIGHVGRFASQKNHEYIIKIFKELNIKKPNTKLFLIGTGELIESIKLKVKELGLDSSVVFVGVTNKVNEYMQLFDFFIFPSNYEGLGIVAIEAQASGLKCLLSNRVPEIVKISDNVQFFDINERCISDWVNEIVKNTKYERKNIYSLVKEKGFDIKDSALKLERKYLDY
jgi:glycosyltransferase involved in cell wall biosynthesis